MWFIFQGLVIFAVVASNIHWQWTPNGYLPSVLGVALAFVLSRLIGWLWSLRHLRGAQSHQ